MFCPFLQAGTNINFSAALPMNGQLALSSRGHAHIAVASVEAQIVWTGVVPTTDE